jgi:hypothetical protein
MNTDKTIAGRDLHRVCWPLCRNCDTYATCTREGRLCIDGDTLPEPDEAADKPLITPEQAMGGVPLWLLVVVAAFVCFVYVITKT